MAKVDLFRSTNFKDGSVWYGRLDSYSASHITITDGYRAGTYLGRFTYNNYGLTGGTLTGYRFYEGGVKTAVVSGISVPALTAASYVNSGNAQGLYRLALRGSDTINASGQSDIITAYRGNDTVQAKAGNDHIEGGTGSDKLFGQLGTDRLLGGSGNDLLSGGPGADTLTGDAGEDIFRYERARGGKDVITDFRRGKDKLQFLRSGFKPNRAGVLAKKHFRFNKQGVARDANDFFLFNTTTKTLYYDSNGNKAGGRMKIATFSNGVDIRRTDIVMA